MHPDKRRLGTLAAVMARTPEATPEAAISHMFTEHVDVAQRLLVLDALCAAAHELAGRPLMPPLTAPGILAIVWHLGRNRELFYVIPYNVKLLRLESRARSLVTGGVYKNFTSCDCGQSVANKSSGALFKAKPAVE